MRSRRCSHRQCSRRYARTGGAAAHLAVEAAVALTLALAAGTVAGARQVKMIGVRFGSRRRFELRGALAELIAEGFDGWGLIAAEADVAMFGLKGCDIVEIAALRGSVAGTARAQLTGVYATARLRARNCARWVVSSMLVGRLSGH